MTKEQEIVYIDQTLKLLRRGKFELTGEEAIILNNCFSYLVRRLNELKTPVISQIKEPIQEESKKRGKK